jgi:hypothetical protein
MRSGNCSIDQSIFISGYVLLGTLQLSAPLSSNQTLGYYRAEGDWLLSNPIEGLHCALLPVMSETPVPNVYGNYSSVVNSQEASLSVQLHTLNAGAEWVENEEESSILCESPTTLFLGALSFPGAHQARADRSLSQKYTTQDPRSLCAIKAPCRCCLAVGVNWC